MRLARLPSRLIGAWLAAAATLAAAALWNVELGLEGVGFLGLALLPWLALAGLPSDSRPGCRPEPLRDGSLWLGAALPLIAIGAGLDLSAAVPGADVASAAIAGALSIAALAYARARAGRSAASAALHAIAWLGLVLGAPLLAGIRATGDGASRWLELAASASPLAWALELARSGGVAPPRGALAPTALALALAAASALPWRQRESDPEAGPEPA